MGVVTRPEYKSIAVEIIKVVDHPVISSSQPEPLISLSNEPDLYLVTAEALTALMKAIDIAKV